MQQNLLSFDGISKFYLCDWLVNVDYSFFQFLCLFFNSAKVLVRGEPNVSYICSRYYRAPELIFGATDYTCQIGKIDLFCLFFLYLLFVKAQLYISCYLSFFLLFIYFFFCYFSISLEPFFTLNFAINFLMLDNNDKSSNALNSSFMC